MHKVLNLLLALALLASATAQQTTRIIYKTTVSMDFDFLKKEVTDGEHSSSDSLRELEMINQIAKMMPGMLPPDTTTITKLGNFIKTTSIQEGAKQRLYELPAKRFLVVENKTGPEKFDTTFSEVFNCPGDTACKLLILPEEKNGKKTIMGFACTNYIVKYKDGVDLFSIWVTNEIKPALPVHAVIQSPKVVLEGYTALEIKEYHGDGSNTHQLQTAIKIIH